MRRREGCGMMRGPYLTGHMPRGDRWSATAHVEQTAVSRVAGEVGRRRPKRKCWLERGRLAVPGRGGSRGDGTCQSYPIRARPPPSMVARITFGQYLYKGGKGVSSFRAPLKPYSCLRRGPHCGNLQ